MTLYTVKSTENLINDYINHGGAALQMREGVLGCGDVLLYDVCCGLKTYVIKEIALTAWSSAHSIRAYNRMPRKYEALLNAI